MNILGYDFRVFIQNNFEWFRTFLLSLSSSVIFFFFGQNNQNFSEEWNEIGEEIKRMINEITIAHFETMNNQLRIVTYESTHHAYTAIQCKITYTRAENYFSLRSYTYVSVRQYSLTLSTIFSTRFLVKWGLTLGERLQKIFMERIGLYYRL